MTGTNGVEAGRGLPGTGAAHWDAVAPHSPLAVAAADKFVASRVARPEVCGVCGGEVRTMCFRATGVCGELCRKARDGERDGENRP
jgi:hypothetical protein